METIVTVAAVVASIAIIAGFLSSALGLWEGRSAKAKRAQKAASEVMAKIQEDVERSDRLTTDGSKLYLTIEAREGQGKEKIIYSEDERTLKRLVNNRLENVVDPKLKIKISELQFSLVTAPLGTDRNLRVQMLVEASDLFTTAQSVVDSQIALSYTQI